ncbi:MAG: hypothetical protein J6U21_16030 [Bacteroidales bacterium]|nr:hypothetical protein [Bacteroidales bacterium]
MKPSGTLVFMIAVLAILALLMTIFPKDGVSVSTDLTLYFPTLKEWWEGSDNSQKSGNAFIPELVEEDRKGATQTADSVVDSKAEEDTLVVADMSGVPTFDSSVYAFKPRPISVESLRQPLDLPASGLGCLKNLFDALTNPNELAKVVRIVHYGDSQIETDRISGYLRYKLQQQFGGSGPGLVPAKTAYDYKAPCEVVCTGDWKRYTIFPFIDTAVHHSKYGALAAFGKFSPIINREPKSTPPASLTPLQQTDSASSSDSLPVVVALDSVFKTPEYKPKEPEKIYNASLEFRPFKYGYGNSKTIKKVRMFYGNHTRTCNVRVMDGETILYADSLKPNDFYSIKTWNFAQTPEVFKMEFSGADSPEIYGFAMDGLSGVAVDNIALRGCSGTIFTKMNAAHLGGMLRDLNVKCIILQFGGNAVPSLNENNVVAFKNYLASQIRYLKRICPGVSIILIGPADMSVKVQDEYVTYEILPELDRLLKEAALQNDCAYWDMYEAMGGYNTMPDWVFHDPPLAEKDFVHFNPNGANAIAKMFYNALIARYNEYISRQ